MLLTMMIRKCDMRRFWFWLCLLTPSMAMAQAPVMTWDFETVQENRFIEPASQIGDVIEGYWELAEGVHGKGLRLDGYTARVIREGNDAPRPGSEMTIQAWVALGEYPLNWCPVIATDSELDEGYRLLVGPYGQVSFQVAIDEQWITCASASETVPLRQWTHIAAVYQASESMTLYINGQKAFEMPIRGAMTFPKKTNLVLGMVASPARPSDTIRTWGTLKDYFGLAGILDEIKVFDAVLGADRIRQDFSQYQVGAPDIAPRRLPTVQRNAEGFGAFYTKLEYDPAWDRLWRVDADPDIAVFFDNSPVKLLFWRGVRYGPAWVSENENWMTDQSLETWGVGANDTEGCFEHMQDRHCRFSHVRMIESHEARAVIHWRYAPVSAHGNTWMPDPKTGWECWVDEYYTIYPDGAAIRKVSWNKGSTGRALQLQESLPVTQPGQSNEELLENHYVTVADYEYNMRDVSVDLRRQPDDWEKFYTVQRFNFKSQNKPFICFEPGNRMMVRHVPDGYNHFPVNQARCDGRWRKTLDRPSHTTSSPCSNPVIHEEGERLSWYALYGMNAMEMEGLIRLGRSWAFAPELTTKGAVVSKGYDRSERCYELEALSANPGPIEIQLAGSKESPVIHPALKIKNWNAKGARVLVNGEAFSDCKIGVHRQLNGTDLIVFIPINTSDPVTITLAPEA